MESLLPGWERSRAKGGEAAAVAKLPAPPGEASRTSRRKLWELEEKHHCPVVGTCLNLDDLCKIARQSGFAGHGIDPYRLHVEAVSLSCTRNGAAEAMHKRMDRKHALQLTRFDQAKSDAEVRALWRQHLDRGEVAGAMWAAITHKHASCETRQAIYEDIHMLSHQVGAGQAADLRRLAFLEREHAELQRQARRDGERQARELADKAARIRWLEGEVAESLQRAEAAHPLRARLEALENGTAMIEMGRRQLALEAAAVRLRESAARAAALEEENPRLRQERDAARAERDALERLGLGETAEPEPGACAGECAACPQPLHGRCVLCVGGRTTLLPQYRQLAERLGVRLIHHDGGREEALSRLPDLLASSDAVICPTDCVSHPAYYQLKRHCKQAGKPCMLVKSSGVGSFAAALTRLAEGRAEIQGE
jgi:hypothetical protein